MKLAAIVFGLLLVGSTLTRSGMKMEKEASVRHVVVFNYTEDASEEQIRAVTDAFRALKDKIPGIIAFEHGVNNSPEGLNQDFTHVYLMTFENAAARDAYLPHPEHEKFGQMLRASGIFEGAFVVDYVPTQ